MQLTLNAATAGERACCRLVGPKFMDECDAKVTDEDGFLAIMKRAAMRIEWPARLGFSLCIRTLALCCTRVEPHLHLKFYLRDVTDGMRSSWRSRRVLRSDHSCDEN